MVDEDGAHVARNNVIVAGEGGLTIGISPAFNNFVSHSHPMPCGRAFFIHLDGLPISPVRLLNVYGPHSLTERTQLWKTILLSINDSKPWIFARDWHFAKSTLDQIGGSPENLKGDEASFWNALKLALELSNFYQASPRILRYTWDKYRIPTNMTSIPTQILKCLDRFYISDDLLVKLP